MRKTITNIDEIIENEIRTQASALGIEYTDPIYFTLPEDDDRFTEPMEEFATACKYADMWETHTQMLQDIQSFVMNSNLPVWRFRVKKALQAVLARIKLTELLQIDYFSKKGFKKLLFLESFWLFPIILTLFQSADEQWFSRNGTTNVFIIYMIFFAILFLKSFFSVNKEELNQYKELRQLRKDSDEQLDKIIEVHLSNCQMIEKLLESYDDSAGLPKEYWPYGKQLWELIRNGRADTRYEAMALVDREIFKKELAKQIHSH